MRVIKKVTFFWNRDKYEGFTKIVRVNLESPDIEIVRDLIIGFMKDSYDIEGLVFYDNSFKNEYDGIITDFKVEKLDIVDLT